MESGYYKGSLLSVTAMAIQTQARQPPIASPQRGKLELCSSPLIEQLRDCPYLIFVLHWLGAAFYLSAIANGTELALKDRPHLRHPVAESWIEPLERLAVANRYGSVSLIDFPASKVSEETKVGERLTHIVTHPTKPWLLAVDEMLHELIVIEHSRGPLTVIARHAVAAYPVSVAVSPGGSRISVASLWSRKVTIFGLKEGKPDGAVLKQIAVVPLEFNPRSQSFSGDGKNVIIGDAFGGWTATVDTHQPRIVKVSQSLRASTTIAPEQQQKSYIVEQKIAPKWPPKRDHRRVIDGIEYYRRSATQIPLGPAPSEGPADRGETLFYETAIATRQWRGSCHTCHTSGHTNYTVADTNSDGTIGTPKRIPTLMGTRLTDPWAWNSSFRTLDEQVKSSLETTLHVEDFTSQQISDITAFLHTLPPPPPLEPATESLADKITLARGKSLFKSLGCANCHIPPLTYTSPDSYDVGLEDEKRLRKFNPPSLRGVSQGYTFFHDGRAKSLEEVFTVYGHQLSRDLDKSELADLLRFLRSL